MAEPVLQPWSVPHFGQEVRAAPTGGVSEDRDRAITTPSIPSGNRHAPRSAALPPARNPSAIATWAEGYVRLRDGARLGLNWG